ncbi:MAG: transcriptional regulator PpsR [Burkholderiales bacterium]|nr:transcriptional regulator PpsR [Burkholderiales bacterium]
MSPSASDPLDLGKLSAWAPELARTFVALSSDIALVIDDAGVIRNVEQGETDPIAPAASSWVGQPWVDTVSGDTRGKIEKLLKEASSQGIARRREVNHPLQSGATVPIAYTAIRLGEHGPVLAVGRDMRAIAAIQERFIETQRDMERGYWNARQAESRHRLLAQVATDAVLIVDPESFLILDINPSAVRLFASAGEQLVGKHVAVGFGHPSRGAVNELLTTARSSGQSGEIRARLLGSVVTASVAATSFRANDAMRLLVRVRSETAATASLDAAGAMSAGSSETGQDAVVVTDSSGRIQFANPALLALLQLRNEDQARSRPLVEWLGSAERPLEELLSQVRRHGVVRHFPATVRPAQGAAESIDISATLLTEGDQECIGFTIHRARVATPAPEPLPQSLREGLELLAGRLGELPLATLLHDTGVLAEHHFIRLALTRSSGNAEAAALLLGVGRERIVQVAGSDSSDLRQSSAGADQGEP